MINGKVYYGGGTCNDKDEYIVYCYSQGKWTTLPLLPVRYFGLGHINGMLVVVGGEKCDSLRSNLIYSYNELSRKWMQTIPPMPTPRDSLDVLSLQSALLVAGGDTPSSSNYCYVNTVEIFKPDTFQWYTVRTDPLPIACHIYDISLVALGNTCYALGGYNYPLCLNQALFASVDHLLANAIQTTCSGSSDALSAWKSLPNTPTYRPAAAVLAGTLLAIGGKETSKGGADMKEIYMYSPAANSWIYISDLPAPRAGIAVSILSSTEILVIGGWYEGHVNTVYKGTIHLS